MSWQAEMGIALRVMVDDVAEATFTDATLEQILVVSAGLVLTEVSFETTYTVSRSAVTISPDPTSSDPVDNSFINLTTLKAACVLDRQQARTSAGQAIAIKDGPSSIDLRDLGRLRMELLSKGGWCPAYERAKWDYERGQVSGAGQAVVGPFRYFARGVGSSFSSRDNLGG